MRGNNPIRKPEFGGGDELFVQQIFPTLQGEGPFVGVPSVFIRLGGCNLACKFCDTEFESFKTMPLDQLIKQVDELAEEQIKLVVITGGEPFRQPIEKLCDELIAKNYMVQIETNGTLYREINKKVQIICSPKNTTGTYKYLRKDLLSRITALKFIISSANDNYNHVGEVGQADFNIPVYVQPMDEYDKDLNIKNMELTTKLAMKNNYIFSLQTHKILGIE